METRYPQGRESRRIAPVTIEEGKPRSQARLSSLSSEVFVLILHLRASENFGDEMTLRQHIRDLFDRWESRCKRAGVEIDDIHKTKFALVACLDETIINSNWVGRDAWAGNPLQQELYDRFDLGKEFFRQLEQLRERPRAHAQVLEVYYLCMALGFEGMYQIHNREKLSWLIQDTYGELRHSIEKFSEKLSPHGRPPDEIVEVVKKEIPLWVIGVCAFALCVGVYLILSVLIDDKAGDLKNTLSNTIEAAFLR